MYRLSVRRFPNAMRLVMGANECVVPSRSFCGRRYLWNTTDEMRYALRQQFQRDVENFEREFHGHRHRDVWSLWWPSRFFARPIPVQSTGGDVFRLNLDLRHFKPENINITVKDKVLTIKAKIEETAEDGSKYYQEMSREYTLPENVDAATLKSSFSNDGFLVIEAPLPVPPEQMPKEIPINHESSENKK